MEPEISVIVPVLNEANDLAASLESIVNQNTKHIHKRKGIKIEDIEPNFENPIPPKNRWL